MTIFGIRMLFVLFVDKLNLLYFFRFVQAFQWRTSISVLMVYHVESDVQFVCIRRLFEAITLNADKDSICLISIDMCQTSTQMQTPRNLVSHHHPCVMAVSGKYEFHHNHSHLIRMVFPMNLEISKQMLKVSVINLVNRLNFYPLSFIFSPRNPYFL